MKLGKEYTVSNLGIEKLGQGMKVWVLLLSQLVAVAVPAEQLQFVEEWMLWKAEHQRSYSRGQEEVERHSVWLTNRELVLTHNANWQDHGYTLALNQFADLVSLVVRIYREGERYG